MARQSTAILTRLGLSDLVAGSEEDYVRRARTLAHDIVRLSSLRKCLRGRMSVSSLLDGRAVAASLEAAYRRMWHRWCQEQRRKQTD